MVITSFSLYNTMEVRCLFFYAKSRTCSFIDFLFVLQALIKNDKIMIAPNYFLIPGFSLNTIWDYIGGIVLFLIVAIWCYRKGSVYER